MSVHHITQSPVVMIQESRAVTVDEPALLQRLARRDMRAMEEVHRVFSPRLYCVALRMLSNESDAAEAVQDTLVRVWEKAPAYDPEQAAPFTWMYLLLRGFCMDRLRRSGRRLSLQGLMPATEEETADPGRDPAQAAHSHDVLRGVRMGIEALPAADRGLLAAILLDGSTVKSMAAATGQTEGSLKVRFHRAIRRLRQLCQHLHED